MSAQEERKGLGKRLSYMTSNRELLVSAQERKGLGKRLNYIICMFDVITS